ncbi:MAG: BRCT domain-containing protein, partial [Cellulosilyticaceae bacterium]
TRPQAIRIVEDLGAIYTPSVTRKTNLVVTGMKDPHTLTPEQMSTKLRRAMVLIDKGQAIDFLTEDSFLAKLHN